MNGRKSCAARPSANGHGLFLNILEVRGLLSPARRDKPERQCARFLVHHRINDYLFERQIGMRLRTNAHKFLEIAEGNTLLCVVDRVGANENRLSDRVCSWTIHIVAQDEDRQILAKKASKKAGFPSSADFCNLWAPPREIQSE